MEKKSFIMKCQDSVCHEEKGWGNYRYASIFLIVLCLDLWYFQQGTNFGLALNETKAHRHLSSGVGTGAQHIKWKSTRKLLVHFNFVPHSGSWFIPLWVATHCPHSLFWEFELELALKSCPDLPTPNSVQLWCTCYENSLKTRSLVRTNSMCGPWVSLHLRQRSLQDHYSNGSDVALHTCANFDAEFWHQLQMNMLVMLMYYNPQVWQDAIAYLYVCTEPMNNFWIWLYLCECVGRNII